MMRTLHVPLAATLAGTTGFQASAEEAAAASPDSVSAFAPDAVAGGTAGFLNQVTGMQQTGGAIATPV